MSAIAKNISKPRLSFKAQTLYATAGIVAAVALPQLFHAFGALSGLGTALGEAFLPMHLPVIFVGLMAGPYAGALCGLFGPLVSFALSGMPTAVMLPFMMVELFAYGLFAGLFGKVKMPNIAKVLSVQVIGRVLRAVAIVLAVYAFNNTAVNVSVIWTSISKGLFGICLQLVLIPLVIYRVNGAKNNED